MRLQRRYEGFRTLPITAPRTSDAHSTDSASDSKTTGSDVISVGRTLFYGVILGVCCFGSRGVVNP